MKEIVVATKNKGKVSEISAALAGMPVSVFSLADYQHIPDAVETGGTFIENAVIKAKHYAKYTGKACLADDSGLEVDALQGAPGVYSARYAGEKATDSENNAKLLHEMQGVDVQQRTARFRCVLALIDGEELMTAEGVCEGIILEQRRGLGGFGYDPLFFLPRLNRSMAELSMAEKNQISHRGQAIKVMADKLMRYVK